MGLAINTFCPITPVLQLQNVKNLPQSEKSCHEFATKFLWDQLQMDSEITAAA